MNSVSVNRFGNYFAVSLRLHLLSLLIMFISDCN